jgi:hypothetical protein
MRSTCWILLAALMAVPPAGCGSSKSGSESTADAASNSTPGTTAGKSATAEPAGPGEALTAFLEAVRTGNDETATKMFTPLARQKASELGIQVAPRGSDTARFEVGKVEMVGQDGARVVSKWTDLDKTGQPRSDDITWMLRREAEGWRVAGMAATVFKGEAPLLLDFEQPEETMRRLDLLREEVQRRTAKNDPGQDAGPQPQGGPVQGQAAGQPIPLDQQAGSAPPQGGVNEVRQAERPGNASDPFRR